MKLVVNQQQFHRSVIQQQQVLPVPVGTLLCRQSQKQLEGNQADAIHSKREQGPHLRANSHSLTLSAEEGVNADRPRV